MKLYPTLSYSPLLATPRWSLVSGVFAFILSSLFLLFPVIAFSTTNLVPPAVRCVGEHTALLIFLCFSDAPNHFSQVQFLVLGPTGASDLGPPKCPSLKIFHPVEPSKSPSLLLNVLCRVLTFASQRIPRPTHHCLLQCYAEGFAGPPS